VFYKGDNRERAAVLRSLYLLPQPESFLMLAIDATRTNVISIFEAIACDNPFPAHYFPQLNFNQMVIRALSLSIALDRVTGWCERNNDEMVRMCRDYVSERTRAGRKIPADTQRIIDHARSCL